VAGGRHTRQSTRRSAPRPQPTGLLPQPPDGREKYIYLRRHQELLTWCSLVGFGFLVVSQVQLAQASPWLWLYVPFLLFTIVYYLLSVAIHLFTQDFTVRRHRRLVLSWMPVTYPHVDVFLPVCGEPLAVLNNSWTHVTELVRSYPGVINAYVLDDSADSRIAALAASHGFAYGSRPDRGRFKKAGNLQYGFQRTTGEYILILDADFSPRSDLLAELLPYFDDPRVGIVQSPQFFRVLDQQNWVERGAGAVQELFYRSVQVSLQRTQAAICVGSCAVYRRASLAQNGGITLTDHSEDVHVGFDLARLGWRLQYVPIALAAGMCPDSIRAFQNQQYRWCSGCLSLLGSRKFWGTPLPLSTRMCYLSGLFYYLHTAVFTFAAPLIPLTLVIAMPETVALTNALLLLPCLVYSNVIFPLWHRCPYRLEAWAARMMYGWAHLFAIRDAVVHRQEEWQPTGSQLGRRNSSRRFWIGITIWGGGISVVWVAAAVWRTVTAHSPYDMALLLSSALFYAAVVGRILVQPRQVVTT
jgi:cellulose synthase (UDP-forming)